MIKAVRGMPDLLPKETVYWRFVEDVFHRIMHQYDYHEIRFPILEMTELYSQSLGITTDIVSKEMYTLTSRNGRSLALRPEGTAGCVRASLQHRLCGHSQVDGKQATKLWYNGPMFRYERPQHGRYRQFHQWGVEAYNLPEIWIEAELLAMAQRCFQALGIKGIVLEINCLGKTESRNRYRSALLEYFDRHLDVLDDEHRKRLKKNPFRILDSKVPAIINLVEQAPVIDNFLSDEELDRFSNLERLLNTLHVPYCKNARLVRGLDYYTDTVFEWKAPDLDGAQNTICAGGRYDGLFEEFGGVATPAIGMAFGLERVLSIYIQNNQHLSIEQPLFALLVLGGHEVMESALLVAEKIRDSMHNIRLVIISRRTLKKALHSADRQEADYVLIYGEREHTEQTIILKTMRATERTQKTVSVSELPEQLRLLTVDT